MQRMVVVVISTVRRDKEQRVVSRRIDRDTEKIVDRRSGVTEPLRRDDRNEMLAST